MTPSTKVLHRDFKIDRKAINEEARTIHVCFASEDPAERWDGLEVLLCTPEACDLSRLNDGGAMLKDHDSRQQIGVVEEATLDPDRKGRATLRFSRNPLGDQEFNDFVDGVRSKISVGYVVNEKTDKGKKNGVQVFHVTDWQPIEISTVAIPLDTACAVGRSAEPILTKSMNTATEPSKGELDQIRAETREKERGRITEIEAIAKRATNLSRAKVDEFIERGISSDAFRKFVFENHYGNAQPLHTPSIELDRGFTGDNRDNTLATRLLGAPEVRDFIQRSGKKYASVEFADVLNVRAALSTRTALTMSGTGLSAIDHTSLLIPTPTERLTVADLHAQGMTTGSTVRYVRESAWTNSAATVAEGASKPELADLDLSDVDATVRKVASWVRISDEMLADSPAAAAYVNMRLRYAVEYREEAQLLSGDGSGTNLYGVLNTSGIQTQAKASDTAIDAIRKGITKIQLALLQPDGIVMHPNDFEAISLAKDANNNYLCGSVFSVNEMNQLVRTPSIWGLPIVVTTSATENTALVGAWKQCAWLFRRQGVTLELSNQDGDNFTKNLVTVRCEERLTNAIVLPAGFCTVTGI